MGYKTILAYFQSAKDEDRVLDAAFPVAGMFNSHVIGFHAEPGLAAMGAPQVYSDILRLSQTISEVKARMSDIERRFRERAERETLACEWRPAETDTPDTSAAALSSARCADLVVVAQPEGGKARGIAAVEKMVFEGGRPVLFIPYAARLPKAYDRVVIAWNGTREAARAAFDAMPFIMAAREVEVFTVDPKNDVEQTAAMAGAEIAATLARHGANVTVETQISDGHPVSAIIENRLADTQADLLVMGAYSHSRLSERLFGGVTRTVLESMPCVTLMSR